MESLFAYTDYRRYIEDYYQEKKRANKHFSLRMLADRCGFKARDYLMRVMRGDRNLSPEGADKLSIFFEFSEKQSEYFKILIQFNQASTTAEKELAYRRLSEIQKYGAHQKLRRDQFEYLSAWYHSALRSLLPVIDFRDDWEKAARLLDPPITAKQAKDSVELLLRLGLLHKDGRGRYSVAERALSTGDEVSSLAVAGFHKATMELAKRSVDWHPASARDISGITMSISQESFRRIKSEIRSFRKKIMSIASGDTGEDLVYQLNLHFFPLTRAKGMP
jgi:uncharacterized protein (TIGR02147 family)